MPANEQTWYNQKILNIAFGCAAVVMLIATVWLLAKDHNRQWKHIQLQNRKKAAWVVQARHDGLSDQYREKLATYDQELREAESLPIDAALADQFEALVTAENDRLKLPAGDFSKLQQGVKAVNAVAAEAEKLGSTGDKSGEGDAGAKDRQVVSAQKRVIAARKRLFAVFQEFIGEARRREKKIAGERKFVAADRTAAVSALTLLVMEGASEADRQKVQEKIEGYTQKIATQTGDLAAAADYRTALEGVVAQVDAERAKLAKDRAVMEAELDRLAEQSAKLQPTGLSRVGEWITRWPILNALYSGNVKIDQIWLPEMTINYNFSRPARFDRCKTCHQDISATAAGTSDQPAFPTLPKAARKATLALATPDEAPGEEEGKTPADKLRAAYGLVLSDASFLAKATRVTVHYVLPESLAASAGLDTGDVIVKVGKKETAQSAAVEEALLSDVEWGEPLKVQVERGFGHPYTSHPRLDLYLSDSSPHPEKDMGCTICHDGQGSGTEFKWVSHTPNDSDEQQRWTQEYGWFDNHHWIFPMKPARFVESNCLKCHHEKGSLEPSTRFPDPPAPKLVKGWTTVEQYGCYGCHEINGFDGPDHRVGPDLRLEPNYSEVALQVLQDGALNDEEQGLARTLVGSPDDADTRHRLFDLLKADAKLATSSETSAEARLNDTTRRLADGLKDVEVPGKYRKVGPSLRYVNSKNDFVWVYNWIKEPTHFRPTTRMPQFFGQWEHLQEDPEELSEAQRFEAVEIRSVSEFLLSNSQEFEYLTPPAEVTEPASAERGKWLFESRGCLACHTHEAFSGIAATQGPDLSRAAAKLNTEKGRKWLYSWVKKPYRYHARTKMPELYLDPIAETDAQNQPTGKVTDPAADIVAFLLGHTTDWKPAEDPAPDWSQQELKDLSELAVVWLTSDAIPQKRAADFVANGIPDSLESKLKIDERLLLKKNFSNRAQQLRSFVARRTIGKYGCFGCHDIPGFEDAKAIGTTLADWGRKESSRLDFLNIHAYLAGPGNPHGHGKDDPPESKTVHPEDEESGHGHLNPADFIKEGTSYFIQALVSHQRDGFAWQKLRNPRSYDYKTTRNKTFNERLRMPRFQFYKEPEELEEVLTFLLGLVSEPPAEKFIYNPPPRQKAIMAGRTVLDRFNCAGCHTLEMELWDVAFREGDMESPTEVPDYPFLAKHYTDPQIAASQFTDRRGRMSTRLVGHPLLNEETGEPQRYDIDGLELEPDDDESDPYYRFTLWDDTLMAGESWLIGIQDPLVPASRTGYGPAEGIAHPTWGGDLARYLYPKVIAHAQETNPQVKGSEAWGWLPPPLMKEGEKVQPQWLHDFLMDPVAIRPAAVLRMPNFHMSSAEAATLVDYFAASSGAEYPYEYNPRQRESYLASSEASHPELLDDAIGIVVNGNYCVKCHSVGDFHPQGDATTFGPNLANVYHRLRPEYVRNWIANPKRILPYTGMPVNIPYDENGETLGGISQDLFTGTSLEQLSGLVDLLMNFDTYAKRQTEVTPLVEAAAEAATPKTSDTRGDASSLR